MRNIVKATATFIAAIAFMPLIAAPASAAHPGQACIKQVVVAAAKAGVETEPDEMSVLVMAPTGERLRPLLAEMIACLNRALPEQSDRADKNGEHMQHFWYITATREYCRGQTKLDTLGGNSDKQSYQSFFLVCGGGQK
jgi:hypothetical protein